MSEHPNDRLARIELALARELDEADQNGPPYVSAMDVRWLFNAVRAADEFMRIAVVETASDEGMTFEEAWEEYCVAVPEDDRLQVAMARLRDALRPNQSSTAGEGE